MNNSKNVKVSVTRSELIKLMLACTSLAFEESLDINSCKMWRDLHDKLNSQLNAFDAKEEVRHD